MKAKEKAIELVGKFKPLVTTWDCYWDCPANPDDILKEAKLCALICVDEMLIKGTEYHIRYWQNVKQEIELLK
ncbi:MAG: hypothetical protein V4549_06555 [Bacteroidota bacterium]